MPDISQNTYDRGDAFLDTGYANLNKVTYQAPTSTGAFPVSQNPLAPATPQSLLDSLFSNLRQGVAAPGLLR